MSRYRFALRPKWILSHLFILLLIVSMINLGLWQIRRLDQKKDRNRHYRERTAEPAVPVQQLLTPASTPQQIKAAQYRRVTLRGTYRPDQEVLVRGRSVNEAPGSWVLTPLVLSDGTAVVVNRGWINNDGMGRVPVAWRAKPGPVTVTGIFNLTEKRGRFGSKDPKTGHLDNLARADVARLRQQVPERLVLGWVQLEKQTPMIGRNPRPLDPPALDEGPHFSYAVQWFIFTTIAIVGYPLILRRRAREIERGDEDDDGPDGPDGPDGSDSTGRHPDDQPDPSDTPAPDDPRLDVGSRPAGGTASSSG